MAVTVSRQPWGADEQGQPVELFMLNSDGLTVGLTNFGARLVSVQVTGAAGERTEVCLGADDLAAYIADRKTYMGALIGRFGNRLAKGRFSLDGQSFQVPLNDGPNALHGGPEGFDRKLWTATALEDGVRMEYLSADGEMGFPGEMKVEVTYTLAGRELRLAYQATCDRPSVVNLTNHAYWNLTGRPEEVATHRLRLYAGAFTPVDATLIPTGELRPVQGTPLDFTAPRRMGQDWNSADEQIRLGRGYDHNWVIDRGGAGPDELVPAAEVTDPASGRSLKVLTTEPGIQFYSGNFLEGSFRGRAGAVERRTGFCLETQHFPDSPNHPAFPSTRLNPGEVFRSTTVLVFG